jgi:carbon storage regulator
MLVIRRRAGEAILLDDHVEITVMEVSAGRVKLGIIAPQNVHILRKELRSTKDENQAAAAGVPMADVIARLAAQLRR